MNALVPYATKATRLATLQPVATAIPHTDDRTLNVPTRTPVKTAAQDLMFEALLDKLAELRFTPGSNAEVYGEAVIAFRRMEAALDRSLTSCREIERRLLQRVRRV